MCETCGCGGAGSVVLVAPPAADLVLDLAPPAPSRRVQVERSLLERNDRTAAGVRQRLARRGVLALNLISSPGAGKTTLLVETLKKLKDRLPVAVIEGDQTTTRDAERIAATGVPVAQINTGKGCHLEAEAIGEALEGLPLPDGGLLFIENVGNLVCPSLFDLGETHKVVILSVCEGDDKPAKYPHAFDAADLLVIHKTDLLPHVDFDVLRCIDDARRVHPDLDVALVSSRTGEGLDTWVRWIEARLAGEG